MAFKSANFAQNILSTYLGENVKQTAVHLTLYAMKKKKVFKVLVTQSKLKINEKSNAYKTRPDLWFIADLTAQLF